MTINIDNQLTFFEDNSAAEIPADFPSVDPGPADMYKDIFFFGHVAVDAVTCIFSLGLH